jgi:Ca2+/H+ antiporter
MTGSKKWYLSKAIWGAIILLVSTILGFFGYTITAEEQATFIDALLAAINAVGNVIGLILVFIGRWKAIKVIKV